MTATIHVGHEQVHEDDVRRQPASDGDRLAAVRRLADHLDVVLQVEEGFQAHANDGVVVDEQHADLLAVRHVVASFAGSGLRGSPGSGRGRV